MRSAIVCFVLLLSAAGLRPADDSEMVRLDFIISTTFGEPIAKAQVAVTSVGPKRSVTGITGPGGVVVFDVPFGLYDVEAKSPGFEVRHERIAASQPTLHFRLGLVLGYPRSTVRSEITGSISQVGMGKTDLWVRLVSVFGSDFVENAVDSAGSFHLAGMAPGRYVLILFDRDQVVTTKTVEVSAGSKVVNIVVSH